MDKLAIINSAMMKTGLPLASSLADCDYNALTVYDVCVEECLMMSHWSFARRHATLERVENDRAFGKNRAYRLPDDYLARVDARPGSDTRTPQADIEISGDTLYCDFTPCNLRYTARVTDSGKWPASFCEAVAALIAVKIASLSAEKAAMVPQLLQYYNLQMSTAQAMDARESTGKMPGASRNPYLESRRQSGQS